jgi:hypothetical protein|tara:strand:+ start:822 stop:1058 length:237 start_codon:yes stop_codon:yes gene_type:complete
MSWKNILKEDWDYDPKYPNINRVIDYQVSQNSNRPMSDIPKLVKQAIIMFGEDLEKKIGLNTLEGETHKEFGEWVKTL